MVMNGSIQARERPYLNQDVAPFWDAVQQRRLLVQACGACGRLQFPFFPVCRACGSAEVRTRECSGHGSVYSYTVVRRPDVPGFVMPVVCALIELDEGIRMVARVVVSSCHDGIAIGRRVAIRYVEEDGFVFPDFAVVHDQSIEEVSA
jgi:3-oxo-4,17-pregnadiene-20-carboxyl-CoA hydratase alpha subunit